jgi:hypothetical protein
MSAIKKEDTDMRGYTVGFHHTSTGGRYFHKRTGRHYVDLFKWSRLIAIAIGIALIAYLAYELVLTEAEMALPLG